MNRFNIKLSLIIGFITFCTAMGVGYYANSISSKQLEKNSAESLLKLSSNIVDILDREMLERYKEVRFASELPLMKDKNSSIELKRELINKIKNNYNHHRWIGYAAPDGRVLIGTDKYLEGKNVKARPWHPMGLLGPYIGDVHDALLLAKLLPNTSGEAIYFLDIAFPVKDYTGETLGVLCTHLDWQWTRDLIRSIEKENSVDIFLLSKDNLVLVGPNKSERKELKEISSNVINIFGDKERKFAVLEWVKGGEQYLTAQTISKGFKEYKGFGWKVIVREPVKDAFASVNKNHFTIFLISVIAALVGIFVGVLVSNRLTAPLKELSILAQKFKNGEEVVFHSNRGDKEMNQLNDAFKDLYNNLYQESSLKKIAEEKVDIALKVFEQSTDGILITDKEKNIILSNKAFFLITGYPQEEIFGKTPSILGSSNNSSEFYQQMWRQIQQKEQWEGIIENTNKQGVLYDVYLKISPIKEKNEVLYYVAIYNKTL